MDVAKFKKAYRWFLSTSIVIFFYFASKEFYSDYVNIIKNDINAFITLCGILSIVFTITLISGMLAFLGTKSVLNLKNLSMIIIASVLMSIYYPIGLFLTMTNPVFFKSILLFLFLAILYFLIEPVILLKKYIFRKTDSPQRKEKI